MQWQGSETWGSSIQTEEQNYCQHVQSPEQPSQRGCGVGFFGFNTCLPTCAVAVGHMLCTGDRLSDHYWSLPSLTVVWYCNSVTTSGRRESVPTFFLVLRPCKYYTKSLRISASQCVWHKWWFSLSCCKKRLERHLNGVCFRRNFTYTTNFLIGQHSSQ